MKLRINKRFRLVVTGVLFFILIITIVPRISTIYQLSHRKKELIEQKQQLALTNDKYQKTLADIQSPLGIERIAREQLGMVKKGERTVIRVVPEE